MQRDINQQKRGQQHGRVGRIMTKGPLETRMQEYQKLQKPYPVEAGEFSNAWFIYVYDCNDTLM